MPMSLTPSKTSTYRTTQLRQHDKNVDSVGAVDGGGIRHGLLAGTYFVQREIQGLERGKTGGATVETGIH